METKMERIGFWQSTLRGHSELPLRNIRAEIECGSQIGEKIDPGSIQGGVDEH